MIGARARVEHNFIRNGVDIWLGLGLIDGRTEMYLAGEFTRVLTQPGTTPVGPSLRMSDDLARALYAALGQYFGREDSTSLLNRVEVLERQAAKNGDSIGSLLNRVEYLSETVDKLTG